jgi:hypothetical protein
MRGNPPQKKKCSPGTAAPTILTTSPPNQRHAPEPPFEIEHFRRWAESDLQQGLRRQQRDVVAGGAIDFDEIPWPEILDPRHIAGEHSRACEVPGMLQKSSLGRA